MNADDQQTFLSMAFDNFIQPKLRGITGSDVDEAKRKWIDSFLGKASPPLREGFGRPSPTTTPATGPLNYRAQFVDPAEKGILETTANVSGLAGAFGSEKMRQVSQQLDKEAQKYPNYKLLSPEGVIEQAPGLGLSGLAGEGAGALVPEALSKAAPIARAVAEAIPFSRSKKGLAATTGVTLGGGYALGKLGKMLSRPAAKTVEEAAKPVEEAATTEAPKPATTANTLSELLNKHGAPPLDGDVDKREAWLYAQGPDKVVPYSQEKEALKAKSMATAQAVRKLPKEVKAAMKGISREEKGRIAAEASSLSQMKKDAGMASLAPSKDELEQLRAGKSAKEVFNPVTPAVVAEQPQMAPFLEPPEGEAMVVSSEPATVAKEAPKTMSKAKIPELGDKLVMSRYSAMLKTMKPDEVAAAIDEDAKTLQERITNGPGGEAEKFSRLQQVNTRLKALKAKVMAGEVGKTSGLSKVGKQGRPATYRETKLYETKETERLAAGGSSKDWDNEFFELTGRSPNTGEEARREAGMSPGEAVDWAEQERFIKTEEYKKATGD